MINKRAATGTAIVAILIATSVMTVADSQFRPTPDKDGTQFGASLDPRPHGYREGYKAGYASAFRNEPPQNGQIYDRTDENRDRRDSGRDPSASRQWGASDMANDVGYRDGVTSGQYDRGRNVPPDYETNEAYRDADHAYSGIYDERGAYRVRYRMGFERGYADGYGRSALLPKIEPR